MVVKNEFHINEEGQLEMIFEEEGCQMQMFKEDEK